MTVMIDPPLGWKYGFPLEYTKEDSVDIKDWLVANGYPKKDVDFAAQYLRFYEVKEDGDYSE